MNKPWEPQKPLTFEQRQLNALKAQEKIAVQLKIDQIGALKLRKTLPDPDFFRKFQQNASALEQSKNNPLVRRNLKDELGNTFRQFKREASDDASYLKNWAGSKHPRIKRTINATESGIQSLITNTTPTVGRVKDAAKAKFASTNSWVVTKTTENAPKVLKGLGNLTDRARPVVKSLSSKAQLSSTWAQGVVNTQYNKAMPRVMAGRNKAYAAVSSAANTLVERYPRLGPVAEGAQQGAGVLTDLLTPGARHAWDEGRTGVNWSMAWMDQRYRQVGALTQEDLLLKAQSFTGKLDASAAEMAYKFNQMGRVSRWGIAGIGVLAMGSLLLGTAKSRSGPDGNLPPNYIPGQQGQKVIKVPWASPYQGPQDDEAVAFNNNFKRLAVFVAPFAAITGISHLSVDARKKAFLAMRLMEDATPFKVGRILGWSSKIGSSLAGIQKGSEAGIQKGSELGKITVAIAGAEETALLAGGGRLTAYGETFARAMNVSNQGFISSLEQRLASGEASLVFNQGPDFKLLGQTFTAGHWRTLKGGLTGKGEDLSLRFYESQSRWGQTFGQYGSNEAASTILNRSGKTELRLQEMLGLVADKAEREGSPFVGGIYDIKKTALRYLHDKFPIVRGFFRRVASIPTYDQDNLGRVSRNLITSDLWVPGYAGGRNTLADIRNLNKEALLSTLKGKRRLAGAFAFNYFRSPWGLLRRGASKIGIDIGPATKLATVGKKLGKVGLAAFGAISALSYLNETLHGALTAPFWNVYERARLLQARISDKLGFTETRKQHPKLYPWSAGAVLFTPVIAASLARGVYRATFTNFDEIYGEGSKVRGIESLSDRLEKGGRISKALPRAEEEVAAKLLRTTGKLAKYEKGIARLGKIGIIGALIAFAPFIFGTKYSEQEYSDIFAGKKDIPIRKGRFWEFGSTPYEGGRIAYFRQHQAARRKIDAQYKVPGGGRTSIFKSLFDPYWREREGYKDRPSPITSTPFEEVPFVGPLLARTLGRFFKPPKLMHTKEWEAGQAYEPFGKDVAPASGLGGLRAPTPGDPLGYKGQIRETLYKAGEFVGLQGYILQSTVFQEAFGGQAPYAKAHVLQSSRMHSFTDKWYESEVGGMLGMNELFRRLYPRPQRGVEVNPLANQMPKWMPGDDYFINFKQGDPYNKVPYGEERLPGKGFEARYPQLKGLRPDQYPAWARFEILADVAPWSTQTRVHRSLAYKESGNDPKLRAHLEDIDWQMEQVKRKKDFSNYDFNRDMETVGGRVSEVLPTGEFRLEQYPQHLFKPAGLRFGVAASSSMIRNANGITKEKADAKAFDQQGEAQQFMADRMLGQSVKLRIQTGGLNNPEVEARIFAGGMNINKELAQRNLAAPEGEGAPTAGFLKKGYGKLIEALGHMPQKVPGPFFLFTKLMNEADPIEEYKRSELYGTSSRQWNKPWTDFLKPYLMQTISKLTPGEFEPGSTKKRRDVDMLFDRLEYMKQVQSGNTGSRTAAGMDPYGNAQVASSAMPYRERAYFQEFLKVTDTGKRSQILSMVSADMQRALTGQWTRQYAEATGQPTPSSPPPRARMEATMSQAQEEIQKAGYHVPDKNWVGWNPAVEVEDVKAVFLRNEGMDTHDFNIWDDRTTSLNRKPYLTGSAEYLTSRPLFRSTAILSSVRDRGSQLQSFTSESSSRSLTGRVTHYNNTSRRREDNQAYLTATDNLLNI